MNQNIVKVKIKKEDISKNKILTPIIIWKSLRKKDTPILVRSNEKNLKGNEKISKPLDLEYFLDENDDNVFSHINEITSVELVSFLKDEGILKKIYKTKIDEDGFSISFSIKKNFSSKQLPLLEGKFKKRLSKSSVESIPSVNKIRFVSLQGFGGAENEEGDEKLGLIFGFSSTSKTQFENKNKEINERRERDHRKIGKELELFFIDKIIGKGLPIWLPNGLILKDIIKKFVVQQETKYGFESVETPLLGSEKLYQTSGHLDHYENTMFPKMKIEKNENFYLRPMACPHHIAIYKHFPHSYKDLPIRLSEQVKMFRYEPSGALIGLERVRAMELTDSHAFIREDQLEEEIRVAFDIVSSSLKKFNIEIDYIELALHDPNDREKYHGEIKLWKKSEQTLRNFLDKSKIKYIEKKGEAAFYGPKIDVQIKTALGHNITVSTVQLDFLLPERFDLVYKDAQNKEQRPIMIHRGLIGTYERFISILLEQTKGDLPFWLTPVQTVIFSISEKNDKYAKRIKDMLVDQNIRAKIDSSNERLSYKIRRAQIKKIKTQIIIGDEEVKSKTVSLRFYGEKENQIIKEKKLGEFFKKLEE